MADPATSDTNSSSEGCQPLPPASIISGTLWLTPQEKVLIFLPRLRVVSKHPQAVHWGPRCT